MRVIFLASIVFLILLTTISYASAAEYHCEAKQAYRWQHGKIIPDNNMLKGLKIFIFTETSKYSGVSTSMESEDAVHPGHGSFQIIQRPDAEDDLVAVQKVTINGCDMQSSILRIRSWDKKSGIIFSYSGDGSLAAGNCLIDQNEGWTDTKSGEQK